MAKVRVLLSLGILAVFTAVAVQAASVPEAKIDTGKLRGKADGNVSVFLGIPYAAPPVGNLRWKAPAPPAKWSGARVSRSYAFR